MQAYLFGEFRVITETHSTLALRPTAARLFAFLLLHRQSAHLREVVAESFWQNAEIERARRRLNTTLWQLRNTLRQTNNNPAKVIEATPDRIKISQEARLWIDVTLFEDRAKQGLVIAEVGHLPLAIKKLEEAVGLYQGDLLTNFYDSWVIKERERLRLLYLRCLAQLMVAHHQLNNLDASIDYAQCLLCVEPWREDIHRNLMMFYAESGRRAEAIAQYQRCRQILESEFEVPPLAETESLYQRLLTNPQINPAQMVALPNQPSASHLNGVKESTLPNATTQLKAAIQTMKDAQRTLDRAIALVERLTQS